MALTNSQPMSGWVKRRSQIFIALAAAGDHRERDHVIGIAMQIPTRHAQFASLRERILSTHVETFTRGATMDEKRIARLFALALGGLFAISLILSAMSI